MQEKTRYSPVRRNKQLFDAPAIAQAEITHMYQVYTNGTQIHGDLCAVDDFCKFSCLSMLPTMVKFYVSSSLLISRFISLCIASCGFSPHFIIEYTDSVIGSSTAYFSAIPIAASSA